MRPTQRALLRLYPRSFRDRFAPELEQVLRISSRTHSGDLARGAATEQWRETMSTTEVRMSDHRFATAVFFIALPFTAFGIFCTIAWIGMAPLALVPGTIAWIAGRRAGVLRPTGPWKRASSTTVLVVIGLALALTVLMWGLRGVLSGS